MNVACDYEAPMQMLTTEKYIASGTDSQLTENEAQYSELRWNCVDFQREEPCTNHKNTSNIFTVLHLTLRHLWN